MNPHLSQLIRSFIARVSDERLLALSEGLIKVRCIEAGLSLGWTAQEGAGRSPIGDVADFLTETHGLLCWHRGPRRRRLQVGSSDVTFVSPVSMSLEIKARPDFGTKAQAQFGEMQCDVERAATTPDTAFLFVFDPKIYLSFSGGKTETRGRPAKAADWFIRNFPPLNEVVAREFLESEVAYNDQRLSLAFWARKEGNLVSGVIAVGARVDSTFQ